MVIEDLLPLTEAHHDVYFLAVEALEEFRHEADHFFGQHLHQPLGGSQRHFRLAEEHRTMNGKMVIVHAVCGVEVQTPLAFGDL